MRRRQVLQIGASLLALPLLPRLALAEEEAPRAPGHRIVARVGKNHGHVLAVSLADVHAAKDRTYDLRGDSSHPHDVTVTAADFARVRAGEALRLTSSRTGHLHRLLVTCVPLVDPPESISACKVTIAGKDEHEVVISAVDIAAKVEKTYDIQGLAGHAHTLTVPAAGFEKLARGERVALKTGVGDGHTHVILVDHKPKRA